MNPNPDWPIPPTPPPPDQPDPGETVPVPDGQIEPDGKAEAPEGLDSTIFSPAFRFVEWRTYTVECGDQLSYFPDAGYSEAERQKQQGRKAPKAAPGDNEFLLEKPYKLIANKWVYLLRDLQGYTTRFGEYYITREGDIRPVDLSGSGEFESAERPAPGNATPRISLAHTVNGHRVFYYAYVSRIRLPNEIIEHLVKNGKSFIAGVDLNAREYKDVKGKSTQGNRLYLDGDRWQFCVTDPLTIALNLGQLYLYSRNDLLCFASTYLGQPSAQRKRVEKRHAVKMVAEILAPIVEGDKEDEHELAELLSVTSDKHPKRHCFRLFLDDYNNLMRKKILAQDLASASLCNWVRGDFFATAMKAHFVDAQADAAAFINVFGQATERITETLSGRQMYGDMIADPQHFIRSFILPEDTPSASILSVAKSSAAAILLIWGQAANRFVEIHGIAKTETVTKSIELILGSKLFEFERKKMLVLAMAESGKEIKAETPAPPIKVLGGEHGLKGKLSSWMKDGSDLADATTRIMYGVDGLNLLLTWATITNSGYENTSAMTLLGASMSSVDYTVTTLSVLKMAGEKPLAIVGGLTAFVSYVCAVRDSKLSLRRHDYWGAVGNGLAATSAALTILSCATTFAVASGASATTVVGVPLAMVFAIGAVVTGIAGAAVMMIAAHSDLQIFVGHCSFGINYGKGGTTAWSDDKNMSEWKAAPGLQMVALVELLTTYKLATVNRWWPHVEIKIGMVCPDSKFIVQFENTYKGLTAPLKTEVAVTLGTGEIEHVSGEKADLSRCLVKLNWPADSSYLIVGGYLAPNGTTIPPRNDMRTSKCIVRLDYDGKGQQFYPASEKNWPKLELASVPLK